jgi:hypothetical protein
MNERFIWRAETAYVVIDTAKMTRKRTQENRVNFVDRAA